MIKIILQNYGLYPLVYEKYFFFNTAQKIYSYEPPKKDDDNPLIVATYYFDIKLNKEALVETIIFKTISDFLSNIGGLFSSLKLIIVLCLSSYTFTQF